MKHKDKNDMGVESSEMEEKKSKTYI